MQKNQRVLQAALSPGGAFFFVGKQDAMKKPGFIAARFETIARQAFANITVQIIELFSCVLF